MRSLVIEDDSSANTMFLRYLEDYGECDTVTTGFDGLQKYGEVLDRGGKYDLIIIDIILPDMNGYSILESIRAEENNRKFFDSERARIVLATSLDDEENRKFREKLKPGLETYYVKSFALDGLKEKLSELGIKLY